MKAVNRGDIFHRYFSTTIPPKTKFFVIVGEDAENYVGYFFINSNINRFIAHNEAMYNMQMPIKPEDYTFLSHVSFVSGHKLSLLRKSDLINELSTGATQLKGRMKKDDMKMLLDAALESPLFSPKEKEYFR